VPGIEFTAGKAARQQSDDDYGDQNDRLPIPELRSPLRFIAFGLLTG
jgi:hypothetical protein